MGKGLRAGLAIGTAIFLAGAASSATAVREPKTMEYTGALATKEQIAAERRAIALFHSPEIRAIRPQLRKILEADPAAKLSSGAGQIDHVLDLWTMAMIMWKLQGDTARPTILWHVENSPHSWFGHDMPGMGAAGDNADHIYRGAFLDGASSYEVHGQFGPRRPAQFSFEMFHGAPGKTFRKKQTSATPDLGNQVGFLKANEMNIAPDGSFTATFSPEDKPGDPNHIKMAAGPMQLAIRDVLGDWMQNPTALTIKRTGGPALPPPPTEAALRDEIIADLPEFISFWSSFKTGWLGGIADNQVVGPKPRDGGWGYLLGGRFALRDDQAITITIDDVGSDYTGFQILNPWLMMPVDARSGTVTLNKTQSARNPDGTMTYVIARNDPGVANWISTGDLSEGMYIIRWQAVPKGADTAKMLRDFRVIDVAKIGSEIPASVPRLDAAGRAKQIAARAPAFDTRLGTPLR